jgi:mono/diheme cytochrome c family protein
MSRRLVAFALMATAMTSGGAYAQPDDAVARGQALFDKRCAICHAAHGFGANVLARRVGPDKSILADRTDLEAPYIRFVVRHGVGAMPRLTKIEMPDENLDAIIAYLTRARPMPPPGSH